MKNIFRLFVGALLSLFATSCYNDFETPAPTQWDETDGSGKYVQNKKIEAKLENMGYSYRTIKDVKQLFFDEFKTLEYTGDNTSWNDTKYLQILDKIYIKGKVQSSDEEGNVYKSIHICDETGAIEIKLGTGNYLNYPVGHFELKKDFYYDDVTGEKVPTLSGKMKSTWVYVKLKDLYLGNYRMMLSIGAAPTDSYNKVGGHKFYANSNLENPKLVEEHVLRGEPCELVMKSDNTGDILMVTKSNMAQFCGEQNIDKLGRLVLITDVTCRYGTIGTGTNANIYPSWMCTDVRPVVSKWWYEWGFNDKTYPGSTNLYGSVFFTYNYEDTSVTLPTGLAMGDPGNYVVRTSGYARFAGKPIVRDGAKGHILANYAIYCKYWADYATYQLTVNRFEDIIFEEDAFLTPGEVYALTPNGYDQDGNYIQENDSYYNPATGDDEDGSFVE